MDEIDEIIDEVIKEFPNEAKKLKDMEKKFVGRLMGLILKNNPKINPQKLKKILEDKFWEMGQ